MLAYIARIALTVLLASLATHAAFAQSGLYVFGSLGTTDASVDLGGLNRIDDRARSYALGAGYAFTRHFALEGAYENFGDQSGETACPPPVLCLFVPVRAEARVTAFSVSVVGSFSLTEKLALYGRVGLTRWDAEFDGLAAAFDDSGEDVHYGIGVRWSASERWKLFAQYTVLDLDLNTLGVGIRYEF